MSLFDWLDPPSRSITTALGRGSAGYVVNYNVIFSPSETPAIGLIRFFRCQIGKKRAPSVGGYTVKKINYFNMKTDNYFNHHDSQKINSR